jgi:molecular chaperone GrpE
MSHKQEEVQGPEKLDTSAEPEALADTAQSGGEAAAPPEEKTEGPGAPSPEELARELEEAQRKAGENWDKLVRAKAELENLRKRHERELENARKFAIERFVAELLPVRDSLELGLSAASEADADVAKLREGKELTLKLLIDVLGKFGIEEVDPEGEPFNPELHQAMSLQPRDDMAANTVVTVVQKGYKLNGRLVRPAMVIVSSAS